MVTEVDFWYYFRNSIKFIELLTAIVATFYFYKYKNTSLKYFLYLLWYIAINEFLGYYIGQHFAKNNSIIYNIYNVANFSFLFYIYFKHINSPIVKKLIVGFYILYIVVFIINGFYQNYLTTPQSLPYIIGASSIVFIIGYYFYEVLNSDEIIYINQKLLFWISAGQILFLVSIIPTKIVSNYYAGSVNLYFIYYVKFVMIVVMNSCFMIGFIWSKKE